MAIPIKIRALVMAPLLASGCTSAPPQGLNPKKDVHCAVAFGVAGQEAERTNAPAEQRRTLFVGNSWYSQLVARGALETPEARQAVAIARQALPALEPVTAACIRRASRKAGFAGFQRRIGAAYDEADAARRR
jgi:hypothetical protein